MSHDRRERPLPFIYELLEPVRRWVLPVHARQLGDRATVVVLHIQLVRQPRPIISEQQPSQRLIVPLPCGLDDCAVPSRVDMIESDAL